MRMITVSRQFGSGGRELGKRLAQDLNWDYYDKEIIETLAQEHELDEEQVRQILAHHGWHQMQLTYRNSFSHLVYRPGMHARLLRRQREIIEEIAASGNDCVIVGRDADVILREKHPFRIYVCADLEARLERTMSYELRRPEEERLTKKEILRNMKRIDKSRIRVREVLTGKPGSDHSSFDLTVNASGRDLKRLSHSLAQFSLEWFEEVES